MYYKTNIPINNEPEFLASDKVVSFTGTVVQADVAADEYGRKIVHKGSLIGKTGKVVNIAADGTLSEPPAGILMHPLDVTYGDQPAGLLVEGYVIGQRLSLGIEYTDEIGTKIKEALPEIKFVSREDEE